MTGAVPLIALLLAAGGTPPSPPVKGAASAGIVAAATAGADTEVDTAWLLGDAPEDALRARIVEMSGRLIGTPYVHSPLGEGEGIDPDPTLRFDAVDCLTFVEETLALSMAQEPTGVRRLLDQLRYADHRAWEERNHLMEAQWLPNNVKKGFLRDVTRDFGGADTVKTKKVLTKELGLVGY